MKIISHPCQALALNINKFLEDMKDSKLIDIKFTSHREGSRSTYAAMVIYDDLQEINNLNRKN
jgi:hypothetical protein